MPQRDVREFVQFWPLGELEFNQFDQGKTLK
jgi:hypothetical protein